MEVMTRHFYISTLYKGLFCRNAFSVSRKSFKGLLCISLTKLKKKTTAPFVSVGGMGMNLSPPFVMSMSLSSSGILAAGTADGRLWLGFGGEKQPPRGGGRRKRTRKWEGLKEDEEVFDKVAEGPIVAMYFRFFLILEGLLLTCHTI